MNMGLSGQKNDGLIDAVEATNILKNILNEEEKKYPGITNFYDGIKKYVQQVKVDHSLTGNNDENKAFLNCLINMGIVIRPDCSSYSTVMVLSPSVFATNLLRKNKTDEKTKSPINFFDEDEEDYADGGKNNGKPSGNQKIVKLPPRKLELTPEYPTKEETTKTPNIKRIREIKESTASNKNVPVEFLKIAEKLDNYYKYDLADYDICLLYFAQHVKARPNSGTLIAGPTKVLNEAAGLNKEKLFYNKINFLISCGLLTKLQFIFMSKLVIKISSLGWKRIGDLKNGNQVFTPTKIKDIESKRPTASDLQELFASNNNSGSYVSKKIPAKSIILPSISSNHQPSSIVAEPITPPEVNNQLSGAQINVPKSQPQLKGIWKIMYNEIDSLLETILTEEFSNDKKIEELESMLKNMEKRINTLKEIYQKK